MYIRRGDGCEGLQDPRLGSDDDRSVSAIIDLPATMSMVEVASILASEPFVLEAGTGLNGTLCQSRHAIGPRGISLVDACTV
jgi:hypothetical protein